MASPPVAESVTRLLNAAAAGDRHSADELLAVIYDDLRRMARARMGRLAPGTAMQPTELVHEAYLRIFSHRPQLALASETRGNSDTAGNGTWDNRGHFFGAAAQAMRNILVEQARRKASLKRGGDRKQVPPDEAELAIEPPSDDVLALDEALQRLESSDPRKARIVLLHVFCGLTLEETASIMEVSLSTIEREWRFTRALLHAQMQRDG